LSEENQEDQALGKPFVLLSAVGQGNLTLIFLLTFQDKHPHLSKETIASEDDIVVFLDSAVSLSDGRNGFVNHSKSKNIGPGPGMVSNLFSAIICN
jgi:hypothetical protein